MEPNALVLKSISVIRVIRGRSQSILG